MKTIWHTFRKNGPIVAIIVINTLLFFLVDILRINNYTETWIFLSYENFLNILYQVAINAIIAFAMTQIIIINGIDLSVGSIISIAGVLLCFFMVIYSFSLFFALLLTLLLGTIIGVFNGCLVAKFDIPPFVITLGVMILIRGLSFILVNGSPVFNDQPEFLYIGNGYLFGIPIPIYILILMFLFFRYLLQFNRFGLHIYALGGNEESARLSGIKIKLIKILVYAHSGLAASVSGIILASRLGSGQPLAGEGYELDAITAVIIGGASFGGGIGTMGGTLAGAIIIGLISNGMNLLDIPPYSQWVIKGLLILIVVVIKQALTQKQIHTPIVINDDNKVCEFP